jgi:hypothetical protein
MIGRLCRLSRQVTPVNSPDTAFEEVAAGTECQCIVSSEPLHSEQEDRRRAVRECGMPNGKWDGTMRDREEPGVVPRGYTVGVLRCGGATSEHAGYVFGLQGAPAGVSRATGETDPTELGAFQLTG